MEFKLISKDEAQEILKSKDSILVDVREPKSLSFIE